MFSSRFRECAFVNFSFASLVKSYGQAKACLPFSSAEECTFKYVSFVGFDMKKTPFKKSNFIDCDFNNSDLKNSDFRDCTFANTSFSACRLDGCDFENAAGFDIDAKSCSLKNARFSYAQAARILLSLGVKLL